MWAVQIRLDGFKEIKRGYLLGWVGKYGESCSS